MGGGRGACGVAVVWLRAELRRAGSIRHRGHTRWRTLVEIFRCIPECPPHPFKVARIRIKYCDAMVPVAVRDKYFIRLRINGYIGWLVQVGCICVPAAPVAFPDLQNKLTERRELQQLIIPNGLESRQLPGRTIVPSDPHKAFMIHMDTMFPLRPVIALSRSTPGPNKIPRRIKDDHGWRSTAGLMLGKRPRAV